MPIYTYKCSNCDHQFEKRQRMADAPLSVCPVCKGSVRRVVNSVGIVFKGSGFYVTDNRNGSKNGASAPAASSTTDNKTDNKEAKKEKDTAKGSDSTKAKKSAEAKVA